MIIKIGCLVVYSGVTNLMVLQQDLLFPFSFSANIRHNMTFIDDQSCQRMSISQPVIVLVSEVVDGNRGEKL